MTHRPATVAALLLVALLSALEATVVTTAMPTVVADLGGIEWYGWVGASYLLASTLAVPLFGKLSDVLGRKRVLYFGVATFLAGSLAAGFAPGLLALVVARTVQGLGAGAMQPTTLTIVGDLFSLGERGKVQAAFGTVWGASGALGPLLGGWIVSQWSWPWVFWVNLPFGLAAVAVLQVAYRESFEPRRAQIDWLGAALLTVASIALLLGAEGTAPALTLPLGVAAAVGFVGAEWRAASPILPIPLLVRPVVAAAAGSSLVLGAAMAGVSLFVPLWAQGVLGADPTAAGSALALMLIGWPVAAGVSSRMVMRVGFRPSVWVGAAFVAAALATLAGATTYGSLWGVRAAMLLFGSGMGLTVNAQLLAVQVGAAHHERGVATSTGLFARSMGSALGAGGLGAVLAAGLGDAVPAERVSALLDPRGAVASPEATAALDGALGPIWAVLVGLALINVVVVAFYPRSPPVVAAGADPR
ncbi:MAG: MFS transporter [Myxococcota bacterium]